MSPHYYIGTSGWHYDHWRGPFYPENLAKKDWLNYYALRFDTVEINSSFYRLPQESTFAGWCDSVPEKFCFAVKASRFITHIKRLKDSREPLNTFIARAEHLKNRLGPLLYQLPASFHRDDERLKSFLELLDKHNRHVLEFRHRSWMDETVFDLLKEHQVGFCIYDMPGFTTPIVATSDYAYIRFHGHDGLYSSRYPDSELAEWKEKIQKLASHLNTVYAYFNNDAGAFAVQNATTLREYLQEN